MRFTEQEIRFLGDKLASGNCTVYTSKFRYQFEDIRNYLHFIGIIIEHAEYRNGWFYVSVNELVPRYKANVEEIFISDYFDAQGNRIKYLNMEVYYELY